MDDLISRQAAIDATKRIPDLTVYAFCSFIDMLNHLPPAERKKGEWIPHEDEDGEHYGDKCSECGEWYVMPYGKTNHCPNCGADMRGAEE